MDKQRLILILEERLEINPKDARLKEKLAGLLLNEGQVIRAENLYKEALENRPKSKNAIWGLAKIFWNKKDFQMTYELLRKLLNVSNSSLTKEQSLLFAKVLVQIGDLTEAIKWFDEAVSLDSTLLEKEATLWKFLKNANHLKRIAANIQKEGTDYPRTEQVVPTALLNKQYLLIEISQLLQPVISFPTMNNNGANHEDDEQEEDDETNNEDNSFQLNKDDIESITLEQVGGLFEIKKKFFRELIIPLSNNQLNLTYGIDSNPKVLLYGPPGCGKSYLCKAFANETKIVFLSVQASDFADLSFEQSEQRLELLLSEARKGKPAVILFDQADWIAAQCTNYDSGSFIYKNNLFNNLLESLQLKIKQNNQIGLVVIVNKPWMINPDYLTTSKINRHIYFSPPNFCEKVDILNVILKEKESLHVDVKNIDSLKVINQVGKYLNSPSELISLVDRVISNLVIEKVAGNHRNLLGSIKMQLKTEHLINEAKKQTRVISGIDFWMQEAKRQLSSPNHPLNSLWKNMNDKS